MGRRGRSSSARDKGLGRDGGRRPPSPDRSGDRPERGDADRRSPRPDAAPPGDVLYGRNPVREALRGRRAVRRVWVTEGAAREPWLEGVEVLRSGAAELAERCGSPDHQGICAAVDTYPYADAQAMLAEPAPLIVALDEVQDPGNLGAICRTAEAAGATGVVLPGRRAAAVTPAVAKAAAGAVEHLPVARVRNVADFLADAKAAGAWCYGAAAGARTPYDAPDYHGGVVLVLGSEGRGLRPRVAAACDALVAIPMHGRVDSLNVGATAAVLLYEILQVRRQNG
jgi:23S rRNA (guanosine2251-2'-O)-methyltransferase